MVASYNAFRSRMSASPTTSRPGLKGTYQDEVVAGVENEVWKNWSMGVKGIYRSLGSVLEDRCDVYDRARAIAELCRRESPRSA